MDGGAWQATVHGVIKSQARLSDSAQHAQYSMERTVNAMKENSKREKIMKVWKDYIIKDVIVVIEKAMKS